MSTLFQPSPGYCLITTGLLSAKRTHFDFNDNKISQNSYSGILGGEVKFIKF